MRHMRCIGTAVAFGNYESSIILLVEDNGENGLLYLARGTRIRQQRFHESTSHLGVGSTRIPSLEACIDQVVAHGACEFSLSWTTGKDCIIAPMFALDFAGNNGHMKEGYIN